MIFQSCANLNITKFDVVNSKLNCIAVGVNLKTLFSYSPNKYLSLRLSLQARGAGEVGGGL